MSREVNAMAKQTQDEISTTQTRIEHLSLVEPCIVNELAEKFEFAETKHGRDFRANDRSVYRETGDRVDKEQELQNRNKQTAILGREKSDQPRDLIVQHSAVISDNAVVFAG